MPSRIVREGIITSPRVNALSLGAEILYRRMMSVADDFGRYHGAVLTLLVHCFPTNPSRFREKEISKWLNELLRGDNPLLKTYAVDGITYLEIQDFGQQQRGKSKFPPPPWFNNQQVNQETAKQALIVVADGPSAPCLASVEANAQGIRSRIRSRSRSRNKTPLPPLQGGIKKPRSTKATRTTEEISAALNGRMEWWKQFWMVYEKVQPAGKRDAMAAFEERVHNIETARQFWKAAKAYAAHAGERKRVDPTFVPIYAVRWITKERFADELFTEDPPPQKPVKVADYDPMELYKQTIATREKA